jgi:hypothetical protein
MTDNPESPERQFTIDKIRAVLQSMTDRNQILVKDFRSGEPDRWLCVDRNNYVVSTYTDKFGRLLHNLAVIEAPCIIRRR